ncbi:MAG: hypothetical protein ACC645_28720, partial [Pirellulales bacterium]
MNSLWEFTLLSSCRVVLMRLIHLNDITRIEANDCTPVPAGGTQVPLNHLSDLKRNDLYDALVQFLQAYADNNPDAVISLMTSRGLSLNPQRVEVLRRVLSERGEYDDATLRALSPEQVYQLVWQTDQYNSSVRGIVIESSCLTVWRASSVANIGEPSEFTDWVPHTWKGIRSFAPNFVPNITRSPSNDGTSFDGP